MSRERGEGARGAEGKEDVCVWGIAEQNWGGGERQINWGGGETLLQPHYQLVGWGPAQERWGHGEPSAQFSLPKITFESPYKI